MKNNKKDVDWDFWWEQVLNGTIPETTYRFARMKNRYIKKEQKMKIKLEEIKFELEEMKIKLKSD